MELQINSKVTYFGQSATVIAIEKTADGTFYTIRYTSPQGETCTERLRLIDDNCPPLL